MTTHRNRTARRTRTTQHVVVAGAILASAGIAGGLIGQATAGATSSTQAGNNGSSTSGSHTRQSYRGSVTSQSTQTQQPQATTQGS